MTKLENRPVCIFCGGRFSLAAGELSTCTDGRSGGEHIMRQHPIPPEHAAMLRKSADNMRAETTAAAVVAPSSRAAARASKPILRTSLRNYEVTSREQGLAQA